MFEHVCHLYVLLIRNCLYLFCSASSERIFYGENNGLGNPLNRIHSWCDLEKLNLSTIYLAAPFFAFATFFHPKLLLHIILQTNLAHAQFGNRTIKHCVASCLYTTNKGAHNAMSLMKGNKMMYAHTSQYTHPWHDAISEIFHHFKQLKEPQHLFSAPMALWILLAL